MNEIIVPSLGEPAAAKPDAPLGEDLGAAPAIVYVNEGRWLVDCPDCKAGHYADRPMRGDPPGLDRRYRFWCLVCGNTGTGFRLRPVQWPQEPERIAGALRIRPTENRNWWPWESVSDLELENLQHSEEIAANEALA